MDEQNAREELDLIKRMVEKTKQATAESGAIFIFWGVLLTAALIGHVVLSQARLHRWIWLNWAGFTIFGWICTVIYGIRRGRRESLATYIQIAARHLYFSCGSGFLLVGLVLPWLGVYDYNAIPVLISVVTGILFFVMGGIFEWPLLRWAGVLWWAGAVALAKVPPRDRLLVYAALFAVGYLVPSVILYVRFRRQNSR